MLVLSRTLTRRDKISNSNSVSQMSGKNQYEQFKQQSPTIPKRQQANGQIFSLEKNPVQRINFFLKIGKNKASHTNLVTERSANDGVISRGCLVGNIVFLQGCLKRVRPLMSSLGTCGLWKGLIKPLMSPQVT